MPELDDGIPLADFVSALRAEIKDAQASADPDLPIDIDSVTVQFTVLTRREGEGGAGVRFWVVDVGVRGRRASESTQTVTMQLTPLGPGGEGRARIRDVDRR
jgi:hypothetical protein